MGNNFFDAAANPGAVRSGTGMTGNPATSVGDALRRAREQRGLTLDQIASTTKIPTRHLEALERGDFGAVPGGVYLRAEIRAYADAAGLNRDVALGWLHDAIDPPPPVQPPPPVKPPAATRPGFLRWATVVGVCVILIGLGVWAATRTGAEPSSAGALSQTSTATVEPTTTRAIDQSPNTPLNQPSSSSTTGEGVATSGVTGSASTVGSSDERTTTSPATSEQRIFEPELDIETMPDGARVTVDGVSWGTSPTSIRYLQPGYKRLRVTKDGFAAEERTIELTPQRPRTIVRVTLRALE